MARKVIYNQLVLIILFLPSLGFAGHLHPEAYYQTKWCGDQNGTLEVIVESGARCDCLTITHAVEFDFASKWAEAVGQSLHYAAQTGKRAGIVLIMESPERDANYLKRLTLTIESHGLPIDVWAVEP